MRARTPATVTRRLASLEIPEAFRDATMAAAIRSTTSRAKSALTDAARDVGKVVRLARRGAR